MLPRVVNAVACPILVPWDYNSLRVSGAINSKHGIKFSCSSLILLTVLCMQGRTTLLVGPPGAGKSVFLQLLAGHFKNTAFCRVTGDVKYNGKDKKDFVIQRTAGLVDQYDEHIANLTVHETLDFATACQVDKKTAKHEQVTKLNVRQTQSLRHLSALLFSSGLQLVLQKLLRCTAHVWATCMIAFCSVCSLLCIYSTWQRPVT